MKITAIVPVWNGRALLEKLLASLDAQTLRAAELLVVDNGSDDGAPELARDRGARVIAMGHNAGFAPAVNRGIREARGEWIAVLNSDVELSRDYFAKLVDAKGWFASGRILRADGSGVIDGTFDAVCRGGTAWRVGSGKPDGPAFDLGREITSPPWTAALFRAGLFERVGLLEESFETYLEDVDFGLRCAARGLTGQYVPDAVAWHVGSASLGRWHAETVRRLTRNQVLLLARHYSDRALLECWWAIVCAQVLWGAMAWRHGRGIAWLRGASEGMGKFDAARRKCGRFDSGLREHLRVNEKTIRKIQEACGYDTYWKLYFALSGGAK